MSYHDFSSNVTLSPIKFGTSISMSDEIIAEGSGSISGAILGAIPSNIIFDEWINEFESRSYTEKQGTFRFDEAPTMKDINPMSWRMSEQIDEAYLEKVYQVFFAYLQDWEWVIAGGSPRDVALSLGPTQDIDIYALGVDSQGVEEFSQRIREEMKDGIICGYKPAHEIYPHLTRDWSSSKMCLTYCSPEDMRPVQIMSTPHMTAEDLVSSFDLQICQFWFDDDRKVKCLDVDMMRSQCESKNIVPNTKAGKLVTTNPFSTLGRVHDLCRRWGWSIDIELYTMLANASIESVKCEGASNDTSKPQ